MPFRGANRDDLVRKNKDCKADFNNALWSVASDEAKDLCKRMLEKDPNLRINVKDAMEHSWFTLEYSGRNTLSIGKEAVEKYFNEINFDVKKIKPDFHSTPPSPLFHDISSNLIASPIKVKTPDTISKQTAVINKKKPNVSIINTLIECPEG